MCGICGVYGFDDQQLVKSMTGTISHRGPDDSGYFFDSRVGLGHRRLSIIDLNTGKQPIFNEDGDMVIIFNGEIFNYKEIRAELEKKGHRFSTNSDTEVILHDYEEKGVDCLQDFNGFFAFAIWDGEKLFIARDRAGIKPLYYTVTNRGLIFASEYKALLLDDAVERKVNLKSLDRYLTYRYVPGNETMIEKIYKLSPGHYMICNKNVQIKRYWKTIFKPARKADNAEKELENLFMDSVKKRMISEVPLGAYLSGGIDSSSIVAIMKKYSDNVKTFSLGFHSEYDETSNARSVAELLGTEHHEFYVEKGAAKILPQMVWHMDDPLGDTAIVANHILAQEARKHVTVVLSGEGADELFGGYMQHKYMRLVQKLSLIGHAGKLAAPLIGVTPKSILDKFFNYPASMGKIGQKRMMKLASSLTDKPKVYTELISTFDESDKRQLYDSLAGMEPNVRSEIKIGRDAFSSVLNHEFNNWLPDDILFKLDKISMASGLEGRVPFLDHRIIEFASRLPHNLRINRNVEKYILRRAVRKHLPREILQRKKHAFYMPVNAWFGREVKDVAVQILDAKSIRKRGYFKYPAVKKVIDGYKKEFIHEKQMISLMVLEMWHRRFIDSDSSTI